MNVLDSFRLNGKVALITGASRGLGQSMAVALAEAGADIATLDRSDGEATGKQVEALGRRFVSVTADLQTSSIKDLSNAVERVATELGAVDILVNNAGTIRRVPALAYSEEDWDVVLQINLKAVFFLSQAAARLMTERNYGKIINIASMLSYQGGILVPSYTAAKSALMGMTRALANEWAAHGINVNAIAPGYMETDLTTGLRTDEARNTSILGRIPAGRWGTPADLEGVVIFLASSASDYAHGITIPMDGGWLAR